jgi:hypothetical protein
MSGLPVVSSPIPVPSSSMIDALIIIIIIYHHARIKTNRMQRYVGCRITLYHRQLSRYTRAIGGKVWLHSLRTEWPTCHIHHLCGHRWTTVTTKTSTDSLHSDRYLSL